MLPAPSGFSMDELLDGDEETRKRKAEYDLMNQPKEKKQKTVVPEHLWLLYDDEAGPEDNICYRFTWTLPGEKGWNDPISGYCRDLRSMTLPPQIRSYIRIAIPPELILDMFTHLEGIQIRKMLDELPGAGMYVKDIQNIILGYVVSPKLARFRFPEDQLGTLTVELYDAKGVLMAFEPEDPKTDVIVYYDPALVCDSSELPK
jgi:hypothetical protein